MKAHFPFVFLALILVFESSPLRAGVRFYDGYVSVLGSYDSDITRLSTGSGAQYASGGGDIRALFFGGLGMEITKGEAMRMTLDAKPYYIKYQDIGRANRGDIFLRMKAHRTLGKGFMLNIYDKYRFTFFPRYDGPDQLFNSVKIGLSFSRSARWKYAVMYRNLYRDNPRENLTESRANGIVVTTKFNPHPRLTLGVLIEKDYERVKFIFPKSIGGRRTWADLSARYLLGKYVVLMGKYMYEKDSMNIVFLTGENMEEMEEGGEEITDGILQSLRFLEDTHNNFRKHMLIFSVLSKMTDGVWTEVFFLHQRKRLLEKVFELPDLPERFDRTTILQGTLQVKMNAWAAFALYARFEENKSNDPDHDYSFWTLGLGSRVNLW